MSGLLEDSWIAISASVFDGLRYVVLIGVDVESAACTDNGNCSLSGTIRLGENVVT